MAGEIKMCHECAKHKITHDFQDNTYGKWMRVHTTGDKTGTSTCTVCGAGSNKKKK